VTSRNSLWVAVAPWLAILLLFFALPLAGLVLLSLTGSAGGGVRNFPTLDNYRAIFDLGSGRPAVLAKTLTAAVIVVLLSAVLSVPVAYYLAKVVRSARVEATVLMLIATTFLVGPLIRTVSWRGILGINGLLNTAFQHLGLIDQPILSLLYGPPAMIVAMTYNDFPFMLFTVYLALKMIDDRYLAAGRDLGASAITTFWRIAVPLAAPGILTGAVLVFVPTLSAVLEPEMLGGTSGRLTATEVRDQFFHAHNWPLGSALTIVLIVAGGATVGVLIGTLAVATHTAGRLGLAMKAKV
jgi:spermidine/putrescine transport system permease protein